MSWTLTQNKEVGQSHKTAKSSPNRNISCVYLPACGTNEGEGDELVPERVILRYGFRADQGLEAGVVGQVTDLTCVGSHLYWLHSARFATLHCFFSGHMPNPEAKKSVLITY